MKRGSITLHQDSLVISTDETGIDPNIIIGFIQAAGSSCSDIAKSEGVTRSFVSKVIHKERKSFEIAYAIANVIGIPTERLWPGDYKTAPAFQQPAKAANE